jgi:cytochrome c
MNRIFPCQPPIRFGFIRFALLFWAVFGRSVRAQEYDPNRFEKQVLVTACNDPMQMEVLPDGRLFFIERNGTLKGYDPISRKVTVLGNVPTDVVHEVGMLGFALDRDFARSQAIFLFFSPLEKKSYLRLARFKLKQGKLDLTSQQILLEYSLEDDKLNHQGGGLFMAANGDLILGTGDNTPPIPELQIDEREGHQRWDAQRTSANSMELRGKILRIHPTTDGAGGGRAYAIPVGNLFPDGKRGRPEIFAMGVRNGFKQFVDSKTGFVYWGDVGQNITEEINVGPNGYDEINQARSAGNFGWPYFTGANEAYRDFDFATRKAGSLFDINNPRNDSPNNTGLKALPAPQPAFIWYPSTESKAFPMLGSGGRSAMVGPVFYDDPAVKNDLKLPAHFDHTLFIHDWMRNWIMAVKLNQNERITSITPFLPAWRLRKPIELKLAADHTLYVMETGDKWTGNTDSQISRIVYRRGNRSPTAVASANTLTGKQPLRVRFEGNRSTDPDQEKLRYAWSFGPAGKLGTSAAAAPEFTFSKPGVYPVTLTVTDAQGAKNSTSLRVQVGNARPDVTLLLPANGSFYEPGQSIFYQIRVNDAEDGSTDNGTIAPTSVLLATRTSVRAKTEEVEEAQPTGLKLMRATTCFGCHLVNDKSIGPAYADVAKRYSAESRPQLIRKIIGGGGGVWGGEVPMPAHPQHTPEQVGQMVDWILSLNDPKQGTVTAGLSGRVMAPKFSLKIDRSIPPVLVLNASYTDAVVRHPGLRSIPAVRGQAVTILHPRRKRAVSFDAAEGVEVVDVFEGGEGNVVRMKANAWFRFETMNLTGITHLTCRLAPLALGSFTLEARLDSPDGPLLGTELVGCLGDEGLHRFAEFTFPITPTTGRSEGRTPAVAVHAVVFKAIYTQKRSTAQPLVNHEFPPSPSCKLLDVNWIDFRANL